MKNNVNICSILSIVSMVFSSILFIIAVLFGETAVMVIFSLVLFIITCILSIIGIVKSTSLKNEYGKYKGLASSIIILVLSIILIFINIICLILYSMGKESTSTYSNNNESQIEDEYENSSNNIRLSSQGTVIYDTIKELKNSVNDPDSFKLYDVTIYAKSTVQDSSKMDSFYGVSILVEYGATNAFGGMVRNYFVGIFRFNDKENANSSMYLASNKNFSEYDEALEYANKLGTAVEIADLSSPLDVESIQQYIEN